MSRRVKGEGSIFQKCEARYGCPPLVTTTHPDGTVSRERPKHPCKGRWFYMVDIGWHGPAGQKKRDRPTVSAKTLRLLQPKKKALDARLRANLDSDGSMKLEDWLKYWMAEIAPLTAKSQRTRDTYQGYIDNWIVPRLGGKRLDRLQPADIRALYKEMQAAGKSAATIRQVHAIITRALKVAEDDGKILKSPAKPVTPPGGDKGSHGKLTLDEATRVMHVLATRPDRARWYAALLLGLRQGEALGLAWDDIDTEAGVIHVRHSLGRVKGGPLELGKVKSQESRRGLPLLAEVAAALRDVPRGTGTTRSFTINPEIRRDFATPPTNADLVWGPRDNKADYNQWQALLKEAGVPRRSLHAARASTGSILSDMGVPSKIIAEILGHAETKTTEDHYIHGDHATHLRVLNDMTRELTQG